MPTQPHMDMRRQRRDTAPHASKLDTGQKGQYLDTSITIPGLLEGILFPQITKVIVCHPGTQ